MFIQLLSEVIREPGGARVTPCGMAGPPGDSHGAAKIAPIGPENPSNFEHCGIARGIITHAHVPRIIVSVEQDETVRIRAAWDFGHRYGLFEPALFHHGTDRRRTALACL